jgi:hypothetical protein
VIVIGVVHMGVDDIAAVEVVGQRMARLFVVVVGHAWVSRLARVIPAAGVPVNTGRESPYSFQFTGITLTDTAMRWPPEPKMTPSNGATSV